MKKILSNTVFALALIITIISCDSGNSSSYDGGGRSSHEEAYTVTEETEIRLTYINESLYYSRTPGFIFDNPTMEVYCDVTNTSDYGGVFTLYCTLTSQGSEVYFEDEAYISSGETVRLSEIKDINAYSFETNVKADSWGILAPTKTVQSEVTEYRTVYD